MTISRTERAASEPVVSLADLIARNSPEGLQKVRKTLQERETLQLLHQYEVRFFAGQRRAAFMLAEALTAREVPPCFRIQRSYRADSLTPAQRFDLQVHDLMWIGATYGTQRHKATGGYKELIPNWQAQTAVGDRWLKVAEYYRTLAERGNARGETWMIVRQLRLSKGQQWECLALRNIDIKRAAPNLRRRRDALKKALDARIKANATGLRSMEPKPVYERRLKLWVCAEMTKDDPKGIRPPKVSPTRAARLYRMWTGKTITRMLASDDLQWLRLKFKEARAQKRPDKEDEE